MAFVALFPANCWSQCLQVQVKSPLTFVPRSIISHSQIFFNGGTEGTASMAASPAGMASILSPVVLIRLFIEKVAEERLGRWWEGWEGWERGEGGKGEMSNLPLLMATQGCDDLKIMSIHIDMFYFNGPKLHLFVV